MEPTTAVHVEAAEAAAQVAEEGVEAAAMLLAEALDHGLVDVQLCLSSYRRAKAQRVYAVAVAESVHVDHVRGVPA